MFSLLAVEVEADLMVDLVAVVVNYVPPRVTAFLELHQLQYVWVRVVREELGMAQLRLQVCQL
jgi:hypothetical protein